MKWMTGQHGQFAYGREHGYLVTREEAGVRLARFSIARVEAGMTVAAITEAVRSVIVFPLGRGPGRPGGEPEMGPLTEAAKGYAETFEAGQDLLGYPAWTHQQVPAPDRNITKSAPPHLMESDLRPVGRGPRRFTGIAEHEAHTVDGPADCARCQLLRDNQDWMAL